MVFTASDALGYHSYDDLVERFSHLYNSGDKTTEEAKDRVKITYYGKNGSNVLGYIPLVGTIMALVKGGLFFYLDNKLDKEIQEHPEKKRDIEAIRSFHNWEKARAAVEFFSIGALFLPFDIYATTKRYPCCGTHDPEEDRLLIKDTLV